MDKTQFQPRLRLASGQATQTGECQALETGRLLLPKRCTLDGFVEEVCRQGGVDLSTLEPVTRLIVETRNSCYRVIVLHPSESMVWIQGGRYFAEADRAYLSGSSYGGNLLKLAWIGLDMRMEIYRAGRRIVTSPVRSIRIVDDSRLPGPF